MARDARAVIGGLGAMNFAVDAINAGITRSSKFKLETTHVEALQAEAAKGETIDLVKFLEIVKAESVKQGVPPPSNASLVAEFYTLDADGNGTIDESELATGLKRALKLKTHEADGGARTEEKLDALAAQVAGIERMLVELSASVAHLRGEQPPLGEARKVVKRRVSKHRSASAADDQTVELGRACSSDAAMRS